MISLDDCIALCGLTEDEVLAIAEHEHISRDRRGIAWSLSIELGPWHRADSQHDLR